MPVRLQPGSWYALPQSPQLFKQLLMVAGMERYYQIARCYRDEDFRADRQPEFTQLDIEMSFVEQDDVIALTEEILVALWKLVDVRGADADPADDVRRGDGAASAPTSPTCASAWSWSTCTDYFADTPFRVFQAPYVGAVVMPGGATQPRKQLDAWQEWAKQRGARGLAYVLVQEDGELGGPVAKNLSDEEKAGIAAHVGAQPGDCVFFAAGAAKPTRALLGAARLEIGRRCGLIDETAWSFLWVVDAPMFEPADEATAAGDVAVGPGPGPPCTTRSPSPKDLERVRQGARARRWRAPTTSSATATRSAAGRSVSTATTCRSGSSTVMGLAEDEAQEKFGFLLDAFKYGAPPHGGIAFGWDRVCALLSGADSIRDVIAFPKTGGGYDPLTAAPDADHAGSSARRPASTRPRSRLPRARRSPPTPDTGRVRQGRGQLRADPSAYCSRTRPAGRRSDQQSCGGFRY